MIAEERITEATDWFMRLRSEHADAAELVPLQQWLHAHPDNAAAYKQVCAMWSAVGDVASSPELLAGRRDALEDARRAQQRRWSFKHGARWWQGLAAGIVGVGLLAVLVTWLTLRPDQVFETGIGERRVLTLEDGSLVNLDARTRIEVRYSDETRGIRLDSGQATFKVSHNPARPFRVSLREQTVVALGTEFNVDVMTDKTVVTLIEGRVAVVSDAAASARVIELNPGQQLLSAAGGPREVRSNVDLDQATAWQSGKLFFDDEPLARAVARINRYAEPQIEVDRSVESIRVSGTFNVGDTDAFTDAVSTYFPVRVVTADDGSIRLTAR